MSKYKFKITYRNEDENGHYWKDNRYTVSIIAETLEQAKQKLDEIEKNKCGMHKSILEWEAEEIIEEKDKEIERLNNILDKINRLFDVDTYCENIYYAIGTLLKKEYFEIEMIDNEEILDILGVDKE